MPDFSKAEHLIQNGWLAVLFAVLSFVVYVCGLMCSHLSAFRVATNLRLQEARIGYTIPRRWLGNVCDVNVSLVGKNLWMIYCKAPFDPEAVATTNNYYQGIDYFMMPSTRNIGFNIKINF